MKLNRIQIDNILGVQSVDVHVTSAITLFAGQNHSGKSSIAEAVRLAITKDPIRDVTVKKNYDALVHDGAKAGGAQIMAGDDVFAFNMPKGDFTGPEVSESMRVSLFGQRFASMDDKERRTFLFDLTGCKPTSAAVRDRLLDKGCNDVKVDAVLPLLRTGFPAVCEHAKGKATEAKGAWRKLTGETYGSLKGEAWEAPAIEMPAGDAAALAEQVTGFDRNIAQLTERLGGIKNAARAAADAATERATLADAPAQVATLTEQWGRASAGLVELEPAVAELRKRAAGTTRVGLVHDLALFISIGANGMKGAAAVEAMELLGRYEAEHGTIGAKVDAQAQALLPSQEHGLTVLRQRVATLTTDLAAAKVRAAKFAALAPADDAADPSQEVAAIEQQIAEIKAARLQVENQRLDLEAASRGAAAAKQKTLDAKAEHDNVMAWSKIGDALAPDGIPAELLADAIAPVNAALEQAGVDTDWAPVKIGDDMLITAGGRAYNLLSESEQWRADAMIAQVVAELSGLKIMILDRVDVLDLAGRSQLFAWLATLVDLGLIDTALLFATLKALPTGLDESVRAHWVEHGTISSARQLEAA